MTKSRLLYIDNLRIFLISLVVLHHLAITYGAPGGWYYNESHAGFPEIIPMAMFVATNQAYFMGMFFFISALFIVPSLKRKGLRRFISDRLIRLGIPTLIFYFLISPFAVYILVRFIQQNDDTFLEVLENGWGRSFGPLWFVEALLIFTGIYLLIRNIGKKITMNLPGPAGILLTAFAVGLLQFVIRLWLPVGWSFAGTNLQFPFFIQYIVLFIFGIIASQNNWIDQVSTKQGWRWFAFAQVLVFLVFPMLFVFSSAVIDGNLDPVMGGWTWESFAYSVWEQLTGFSIIMALFGIFKKRFNTQGKIAKTLSGSAYGVFILHTPVLVIISALFLNFDIPQILKFIVLAPVALIGSFALAWILKQIPGIKKVL